MRISNSLLISTYNWPEALEICLLSVFNQSILPDEIVIADDGSENNTKKLIDALRKITSIPIIHIWHEDNGFRKTIILNESIKRCNGNYIIQIDGDIILDKFFVEDHLHFAHKGFYIRGSRTLINEANTNAIISDKNAFPGSLDKIKISSLRNRFIASVFTKLNNPLSIEGVKGCNMSFWKKDCFTVNGYNNDIMGWGREDSEFASRLINAGFLKKHVKFSAVCFHLHHDFFSRDNDEKNLQLLQETQLRKIKFCTNGINNAFSVKVWQ
ncbi:MAG: glycosyltransferase family 2 protein [Bacteroidetes bacterium]|nr:glycosyltransferase family 2 protein [Bacteroidota bacterium]